ncbi:hypothetical protein INS49_011502 [Diaporthe citri]|uniref:uncharacterized protein n=1 Tax=Diaporthe citri TaxID=83186 RepID=UPI001C826886|nr:uncharacterized protein INS49_011502 [Diaporthe citri]KAG6360441.1 hypothetical protein INS49_011502 [Diaporthe citri]
MLRRSKKNHTNSIDESVKYIYVHGQFFSEAQNSFANSILTNGQRELKTYVAPGVLLNTSGYANISGIIMQIVHVADHPDLILKKNSQYEQNILISTILVHANR